MDEDMHTHSINALIRHSRRCAPQRNAVFPRDTPAEKQLVHVLEEAYRKARYKSGYSTDTAIRELHMERVEQPQTRAGEIFKRKVHRLL